MRGGRLRNPRPLVHSTGPTSSASLDRAGDAPFVSDSAGDEPHACPDPTPVRSQGTSGRRDPRLRCRRQTGLCHGTTALVGGLSRDHVGRAQRTGRTGPLWSVFPAYGRNVRRRAWAHRAVAIGRCRKTSTDRIRTHNLPNRAGCRSGPRSGARPASVLQREPALRFPPHLAGPIHPARAATCCLRITPASRSCSFARRRRR